MMAVGRRHMVATFLQTMTPEDPDDADHLADFGRPSVGEAASIVALAARLRLSGIEAQPRAYVWGEAVRLVALVGLLVNGILGSAAVAMALWEAGRLPLLPRPSPPPPAHTPTPLTIVLLVNGIVWMGAYLALVQGRRRPAQVLAGLALFPILATAVWRTAQFAAGAEPASGLLTLWCTALINVCVVAALAAFHRDAPPVPPKPWLVAGAVGMGATPAVAALALAQMYQHQMLLDWDGMSCLAVAATAIVLAIRGSTTPWTLALGLLAAGTLILRVASLVDYTRNGNPWEPTTMVAGIIEAAAVLGAGTWAALASSRAFHNLPPSTYTGTGTGTGS